jgi:hypothetical protein
LLLSAEGNAYNQAIQCVTCEGCTLRKLPETFWQQSGYTPNEAAYVLDTAFSAYGSGYTRTWHEDDEALLPRQVADFSQNVFFISELEDRDNPGILVGATAEELTFITDHDGAVNETPFIDMQPETKQIIWCLGRVTTGQCGSKRRGQNNPPATRIEIDLSALADFDLGADVLETYARATPETELWDVFKGLLPDIELVLAAHAARSGKSLAFPNFTHTSDPGDMRQYLFAAAQHLREAE